MHTLTSLWAAAALCAPAASQSSLEPVDHAQLTQRLQALAAAHPERCALAPIGRSRANRDIWCLRLGSEPAERARPAILLVANLEGPQVFSSALALALAERVAGASDGATASFLASTTLYVVPRLDVDAAEARFATPLAEVQASGRGVDDDRDGRAGEDPPADVDGDGRITLLRKLDPAGEWLEDPHDARALVRADRAKGERGRWKVWSEGRDLDHDEQVAEDAPADARVNSNFPYAWREHDPYAGLFATDEPGARALCDFVLEHRDLAAVVTLGGYDDLVEKPKTGKEGGTGQGGWLEADAALLAEVGRRYVDITGNKTKGTRDDAGSFQGWAYQHRGLWVFAANPWDVPLEAPKPEPAKQEPQGEAPAGETKSESKPAKPAREPSDDAKRLKWLDASGEGSRFVPWRPFTHPELGEIEIGGFAPYARIEPPAEGREELARTHGDFVLTLGALLPRVAIAEFTARPLGADVWEVRAAVANEAYLPLSSAAARRNDAVRPARVTLVLGADDALLAGARRELVRELPGTGGRRELKWLVRTLAPRALALEVDTDNAGLARRAAEVKP